MSLFRLAPSPWPRSPASRSLPPPLSATAHAAPPGRGTVYVLSNQPAGNAVLRFDRSATARSSHAGEYPTGGTGTGGGLGSQGAVTIDDPAATCTPSTPAAAASLVPDPPRRPRARRRGRHPAGRCPRASPSTATSSTCSTPATPAASPGSPSATATSSRSPVRRSRSAQRARAGPGLLHPRRRPPRRQRAGDAALRRVRRQPRGLAAGPTSSRPPVRRRSASTSTTATTSSSPRRRAGPRRQRRLLLRPAARRLQRRQPVGADDRDVRLLDRHHPRRPLRLLRQRGVEVDHRLRHRPPRRAHDPHRRRQDRLGDAGVTDLATTADGRFLYARMGDGTVGAWTIERDGSLASVGAFPGLPAGAAGIAAT